MFQRRAPRPRRRRKRHPLNRLVLFLYVHFECCVDDCLERHDLQTSQKASGGTRAQAMRAAAVRRRSIETEQARSGGKPAAVSNTSATVGKEAEEKKRVVKDAPVSRVPGDAAGSGAVSAKGAGKTSTAKDADKKGAPCPLKVAAPAPTAPQPPASRPQASEGAPRPKSRLYAQKSEAPTGDTKTDGPDPPEASRPKSTARRDIANPPAPARTDPRAASPTAPASPPASSRPKSRSVPASSGRTDREAAPVEAGSSDAAKTEEQSTLATVESTPPSADRAHAQEPAPAESVAVVTTEESGGVPSGETNEVPTEDDDSGVSPAAVVEAEASGGGEVNHADTGPPETTEVAAVESAEPEEPLEPSSSQLQASTTETPLEYSMDFENSSAHAEVFKVHD